MKNLYIKELCVEITRKCNYNCMHCFRGNSQNINLSLEDISNFFNNTNFNIVTIEKLIITGGEPTLNSNSILEIIKQIIKNKIQILSFTMVINGSNYNEKLIENINLLYNYQQNKNYNNFNLICSLDQFHEKPKKEIINKYNLLPFFKSRYREYKDEEIINLGRAYENNMGNYDLRFLLIARLCYYINNNYPTITKENNTIFLEQLYLSAKGLYGFYIMDGTYDMIDDICIYKLEKFKELLNSNQKIKRRFNLSPFNFLITI